MSNYHRRIMNLPTPDSARRRDSTPSSDTRFADYSFGHHAARHAAAEIALEADRQIAAAEELAAALVAWNAADEHWVKCADCADEQRPMCRACFAILQSAREKRVAALAAWNSAKEGK